MPAWVIPLLEEALKQFPIVLILGVGVWLTFRYITEQHTKHLLSVAEQSAAHLKSKDEEIQRLQKSHEKETKRLTEEKAAEIERFTKLLMDAQKERDRLHKLIQSERAEE